MLNESVGKNFPSQGAASREDARRSAIEPVRLLVVDDVIGSRFALVQAASRDDRVVDAVASTEAALRLLERHVYALVLVDARLEAGTGLAFLESLRATFPDVARALITDEQAPAAKRDAIARADLAFLLTRPWSAPGLSRTLRAFFDHTPPMPVVRHEGAPVAARSLTARAGHAKEHERIARGLLAGLNACTDREEIVALLRQELSDAVGLDRWILRRESGSERIFDAVSPSGRAVSGGVGSTEAFRALDAVVGRAESTRETSTAFFLECEVAGERGLGVAIPPIAGAEGLLALAIGTTGNAGAGGSLLRAVEGGLVNALARVAREEDRSRAAHRLARRVSEALRSRLGDLAHAIDGLRHEAAEIGLSPESVERIRSESEELARAVEHVEGEILGGKPSTNPPPA